jgi:hypothetical protein
VAINTSKKQEVNKDHKTYLSFWLQGIEHPAAYGASLSGFSSHALHGFGDKTVKDRTKNEINASSDMIRKTY